MHRFDNHLSGKGIVYDYDTEKRMVGYAEFDLDDMSDIFSATILYNDKSLVNAVYYDIEYSYTTGIADNEYYYRYVYNHDDTLKYTALKTLVVDGRINYTYDTINGGYFVSKAHSGHSNQTIMQSTQILKWVVMGISDDAKIELISTTPTTGSTLYLAGAAGYNNGVFLLNDACKTLYSNSSLGVKARSLTIDDIEEKYSDAGINARNNYLNTSANTKYGETKIYTNNIYPVVFAEEIGHGFGDTIKTTGIGKSDPYYDSLDGLSIAYDLNGNEVSTAYKTAKDSNGNNLSIIRTQTYYLFNNTLSEYFNNDVLET